jgi:hypothetical protein
LPKLAFPVKVGRAGQYYGTLDLSGTALLTRSDAGVNFNWDDGAPADNLPSDEFSARWTRTVTLSEGTYRFYVHSDDGVRVWLNGELIIDEWYEATPTTHTVDRTLSTGAYTVQVDYYESAGTAQIQFWWERLEDYSEWRGEYFSNTSLSGSPAVVTNTVMPTITPSSAPTLTPSPDPSDTPTLTPAPTDTPTPTQTLTPTPTPTDTEMPTATLTLSSTPSTTPASDGD